MVLALVQARMTSSRLPGKVLEHVSGAPMILRQLERVSRASCVDRVMVATSHLRSDDRLVEVLTAAGIETYRGPLEDVLGRYLGAIRHAQVDRVLRVTADCPLIDPDVIDLVDEMHTDTGADYASNVLQRTYPQGLDVEAVTREALERIEALASFEEREHVTLGIYRRPEDFTLASVVQESDQSHLRWTVDLPADLSFVRSVYDELYASDPQFGSGAVLALLERRPELIHTR